MKHLKLIWREHWTVLLISGLGLSLVVGLLVHRLYKLAPGISSLELLSLANTTSFQDILLSPVYLPFKLGEYLVFKAGFEGILAARAVVVVGALAAAGLFFNLLRRWYTTRIATLGTLLFITSSWFLHVGRSAVPFILFPLVTLLLITIAGRIGQAQNPKRTLAYATGTFILCLYVPAMFVVVIALCLWQQKVMRRFIKQTPIWLRAVCLIAVLVSLAPIIYAAVHSPVVLKDFLAVPTSFHWLERLKQLVAVPYQLFLFGPENASLWLARLPILDIFTVGMAFIGTYSYYLRRGTERSRLLLGLLAALTLIIGLTSLPVYAVIPLIYLAAAAGINLVLQQWFTVFPRNPLARYLGILLMTSAVLFSCWYHINRYFVAWANAPATKANFIIQKRP